MLALSATRRLAAPPLLAALAALIAACGSTADPPAVDPLTGLPIGTPDPTQLDAAAPDGGEADAAPPGPVPSRIEHVVILMQENHTFDTYFGRYCKAPPGSNPTCTAGPACCEAAPEKEPSGASPRVLDDAANADYDPNHSYDCEAAEMNGGKMDRYVTGTSCANPKNFAIAPDSVIAPYHALAQKYAVADRYFQSIIGQTSSNDMYFAVARKVFIDNDIFPDAIGQGCRPFANKKQFVGQTTIADLLLNAGHRVKFYAEGYKVMRDAKPCPKDPPDCKSLNPLYAIYPCAYDPSDIPFNYYRQFTDNPAFLRDWDDFYVDLDAGNLPEVSFVKPIGYHTEHPGYGTKISLGVAWIDAAVNRILASPYGKNTLILLTWDEGGGYFDHVGPPGGASPADDERLGTRVPLLAIGRFARKNHVSHVVMEHSSIVKYLEWQFTGATGQLAARDALVNNIGSLLDPAETGLPVPEN
ncbi:MAG TPA: alkaline phosphatase family protein [Polyangiaceae bacterium]|nr:alkaline phosphatase family protein [Polyangiaceae bacterium]